MYFPTSSQSMLNVCSGRELCGTEITIVSGVREYLEEQPAYETLLSTPSLQQGDRSLSHNPCKCKLSGQGGRTRANTSFKARVCLLTDLFVLMLTFSIGGAVQPLL